MKTIYLLQAAFCFLVFGCGKTNGYDNPYHNRMKKLADEMRANPNDKTTLHKLEKYTVDSDEWNRSYAYGFLGELAFQDIGNCRAELIPYFNNALTDSDDGVRQSGIQAILDVGSPAVEKSLPNLLGMISQGKENDITWSAADALGELVDPKKAQEILPALFDAANKPPPKGTANEAPQLRYEALDSIKMLAQKNNLNVVPDLEHLLIESKPSYAERVAKAILELDSTNRMARQFITRAASSK
jgi:hypothetical protein